MQIPIELPEDLPAFAPQRERTLEVMGAPVQLAWLPERRHRTGFDRDGRSAFERSPAARILAEESLQRSDALALTPNRFPFAQAQRILWMAAPAREPDLGFWTAALDWADRSDGTVLLNTIGAAATIPRAHAHLTPERLPFLHAIGERPLTTDLIDVPQRCELVHKELDRCVLGVRGPVEARAAALVLLADARPTPAWNVVASRGVAWAVPRGMQTPSPHFPAPLGAAELWGRYCYVDERDFEQATAADLEAAFAAATMPAIA